MKHLHWDFAHREFKSWEFRHWNFGHRLKNLGIKNFDSSDVSTFAILGAAIALIVLMATSLFTSTPMESDLLMFPHP